MEFIYRLYIAVLSDEVLQSWLIKYGEVKNNKEREGELIVKRIYGKPIAEECFPRFITVASEHSHTKVERCLPAFSYHNGRN